ncbi:F-box/FBD/LRR-repeat protein At5g56420-like [Chenopodium quinoa]|uniref:F-box/FBD/LRR-repeat protein At5g56420-like n=1 Tax=Chenopodium quinoa TaxID=63459 RepID=UPI000B781DAB|nr:F-box/FBD/LRR-repeat protein At5g56420-like [Chenopodium quinoa]XP_021740207.1 F-box/FBD/LRR-repeat protein At5g56420-like [Chenopodium quinoa]
MGSTSNDKKASMMKNNARDRLSELPDDILVHILSFLPILDAVRTVLIRRFGNLWTLVSSLNFRDSEFLKPENWPNGAIESDEQGLRFGRFVRNVLKLHKRFPVNKFLLHFYDIDVGDDDKEIKSWVSFAIKRQVKELNIQFDYDSNDYILPRCVFKSPFLVKLKLVRCDIEGLSRVQMGSLRKLSLNYVKVSNEMFKKVIFGCPCLQELVLMYVDELEELQFTAPNIKKLDLGSCDVRVLDCPNLKILNIYLSFSTEPSLQEVNISSVREVHIQSCWHFDKIVDKICKAEVVKVSAGAFSQSNFKELDMPQTRWKRLHFKLRLNEDQLIGICRVLRSSPHLEELIVCSYSWQNLCRDLGEARDHHMLSEELSSPCVLPQLKTISVTICGLKVPCQGLLRLAEFLLKSCVNLERMVISPSTYELVAVEELKFVKQLLSFPRGLSQC